MRFVEPGEETRMARARVEERFKTLRYFIDGYYNQSIDEGQRPKHGCVIFCFFQTIILQEYHECVYSRTRR
ncbi:hypothetical protein ETC02_03410 [Geobacillus sp. DSP4a]|nr:hypothetical protein [Geobacillus sp. DSP4a]